MGSTPLPIATDELLVPPGLPHVTMLYPFWGRAKGVQIPRPDFADAYERSGSAIFSLGKLEGAAAAIFPREWKYVTRSPADVEAAQRFAETALAAGVTPVVFYVSDTSEPVPIPGALIVRTSLHRSVGRIEEIAQPGFQEDLLEYVGGAVPIRPKSGPPIVGFCGVALAEQPTAGVVASACRSLGDVRRRALERRGRPLAQDVFIRARALEALRRCDDVRTSIVVRADTVGGAVFPQLDLNIWKRVRQEYVENMMGSDYVLCARGVGNWSYRLYETLSLGRIPVFVDTDCVLPLEDRIDWRALCVWVDRPDVGHIGEKVAAFHDGLSDDEFQARQHACRSIWERYLSPLGFFTALREILAARGAR